MGLLVGPAALVAALLLPVPEGLSAEGWRAAGTGALMAVWWVTEPVPIPVTALLPLVLLPLLEVTDFGAAAAPFANPLIFLFLGGFLLAAGMERHGLPRRVALAVSSAVGGGPAGLVLGFMVSAALLSMGVSNSATAMIMLPIGTSVLALVGDDTEPETAARFGPALMLGIAYGCSIGGIATLIGTPPNAFLAGFFEETYGVEISFVRWLAFGLPVALVGLPATWWILTRIAFPLAGRRLPGGRQRLRERRRTLGPMSGPERRVAAVAGTVALLWILRPLLEGILPGLSDAGIAMAGGLALFLIPAGRVGTASAPVGVGAAADPDGGGSALLSWRDAERIPWGVLVLFGGGLSLAAALHETGVTTWLGGRAEGLAGAPLPFTVAVLVLLVLLLTELTSNTATAAALLPVLAAVAVGIGQDPRTLAVPAALAASCAFMLPVATPPNAIVYASGAVEARQMARAGLLVNLLFLALITLAALVLLPSVFGATPGAVPPWAAG